MKVVINSCFDCPMLSFDFESGTECNLIADEQDVSYSDVHKSFMYEDKIPDGCILNRKKQVVIEYQKKRV